MSYRDDLDAAHARADALEHKAAALEQRNAELTAAAGAAPGRRLLRARWPLVVAGVILTAAFVVLCALLIDRAGPAAVAVTIVIAGAATWPLVFLGSRIRAGAGEVLVVKTPKATYFLLPGHHGIALPFVHHVDVLDVQLHRLAISLADVACRDGKVDVEVTAQVQIPRRTEALERAGERFLGQPAARIAEVARDVVAGTTREVVAGERGASLRDDAERLAERLEEAARAPLDRLGLEVVAVHAHLR